jgi:hypothetical protein
MFGRNAFSIPIAGEESQQYVYLPHTPGNATALWQRVTNSPVAGPTNYFTWLNAYNSNPAQPGTIRQAMLDKYHTLNPFAASAPADLMMVSSVYDTLEATNPVSETQGMFWMITGIVPKDNSQLGYTPPPGTLLSYHITLRSDLFFQDGKPVTAFDVAFSYLALSAYGAFLSGGAAPVVGVTVLGGGSFDLNLNQQIVLGVLGLTSVPILPGRWWTSVGKGGWDNDVSNCWANGSNCFPDQYVLRPSTTPGAAPNPTCLGTCIFPATDLAADPTKASVTYDPINKALFIGSGPWQCGTVIDVDKGSGNCSSTGYDDPPPSGSIFLTRFGQGHAPASSTSRVYFRSSGDLALYIWSEENDVSPIQAVSAISNCYGQPVNLNGPCAHWQQGIGASSSGVVGINQISVVEARYGLNWVAPFEWATNPPAGIGSITPVLYEGSVTLKPCSLDPRNGYDC